jgi:hypothetical protein
MHSPLTGDSEQELLSAVLTPSALPPRGHPLHRWPTAAVLRQLPGQMEHLEPGQGWGAGPNLPEMRPLG